MLEAKISIYAPFRFCEKCKYMDVDIASIYSEGKTAYRKLICKEYERCKYIVDLYKQEQEGAGS